MSRTDVWTPAPIAVQGVELPEQLSALLETLACHVHDLWAQKRLSEGWQYGPVRSDELRTTPNLVPYIELPEGEKEYDREVARGTLLAIIALGYQITPRLS